MHLVGPRERQIRSERDGAVCERKRERERLLNRHNKQQQGRF